MLVHPQFDPIAVQAGPLAVHWYGLMYLIGLRFFISWVSTAARQEWRGITKANLEDLLFVGMVGVIVGGRLGFVLLYQPEYYLTHPLEIFAVWQGGMSAHGGFIGVILALFYFAWRNKKSILTVGDFVAPLVPLGFFFGRLGNFINGELWGRVASADLPWSMIFPQAGDGVPRHPSQLYEATLEGLVAVLRRLDLFNKKETRRCSLGSLLIRLRAGSFCCGILPRARQLLRSSGLGSFKRPVAFAADDHYRAGLWIWACRRKA